MELIDFIFVLVALSMQNNKNTEKASEVPVGRAGSLGRGLRGESRAVPKRARSGFAGFLTLPDYPQPPPQPGGIGDCVGGLSGAAAVAAALFKRERTGHPARAVNAGRGPCPALYFSVAVTSGTDRGEAWQRCW